MRRLALAVLALVLLRGDMFQDASNAKLPEAGNNLFPGLISADLKTANSAAENSAAFQAAITAACGGAAAAYRELRLPPGNFSIASTTINIPCGFISIGGAGYFATTLNVGPGDGDFLKCVQPPNTASACWHTKIHDFTILRSDSPASGAGLFLDHANDVQISAMRIYGFYTNVDCNSCGNVTLDSGFNAGGAQSQAGSAIVRIRRTITAAALSADWPSGTTVTLPSLTGVYLGQTVTGHANIQAATTVASCNAGTSTCILSKTPTGTVPSGTALTFTDNNSTAVFFGDGFNLGANPSGNYDNALVVNNVDGLNLGNGHISYTRGADLLIQPGHASDGVHGVVSAPNTYFDQTGSHCVAVKAYGAVDATTGALTAASGTTLTLSAPPAVDVTGYSILANGVTAGTTISSGGATATMTMSAGANALGIANGAWVTFYPAFTGAAGTHKLYGICNSPGVSGVLLADPAVGRVRLEINGHNSVQELYDFRAGSSINATGSLLYNAGQSGGSFPAVRVGGNASFVTMSGVALVRGTVQPQYHVKKEGQAGPVQISGQFVGSGIADVLDTALVPGKTSVAGCITDNSAQNNVPGVGCAIGAPVQQIAGSGLPFVIPSSGSMANNGALTVTTALAGTYLHAYFWMPANAIAASSAAGWYYTTCSSTTACSVRNNAYTAGVPSVPTSPVVFATTGPGAYTQDLTEIIGQSLTVPANSIGQNGTLQGTQRFVMASSANNKTAKVKFAGSNAFVKAYTTNTSEFVPVELTSRSRTNQQISVPIGLDTGYGANTALFAATGADVTAATTYALSCQLANAADYCVMDSVRLVAFPAQ